MPNSLLTLTALLLAAGGCGSDDGGWPRWRGPTGNGVWNGPALASQLPGEKLEEVWRKPIGGGYSGITVAGGRIYTMDRPAGDDAPLNRERVLCLDPATGETVWEYAYDIEYKDLPFPNGPRSTPTIDNGRVYTLGAVGHVHCLDAKTGSPLWSLDAVKDLNATLPQYGFAASPVIDGDTLLLNLGAKPTGSLVACDKATGKILWRASEDDASYATPILITHPSGQRQIIHWSPSHAMGIDPKTGAILWSFPFEVQQKTAIVDPLYRDGKLLLCTFFQGSKMLTLGPGPADVALAWESPKEIRPVAATPILRDDHAYTIDGQAGLVCFQFDTGEKKWDDAHKLTPRGGNPQVSFIALTDTDTALALNHVGELVYFRYSPEKYEELWRVKLLGETWAHPAPLGDTLIARSDTEIVRVKLPLE